MPTSLSALVASSRAVAETPSRLGKIDHLAALLTQVAPDELPIAIAYLSGATPQGRMGIGGAAIREARDVPPADAASLTLAEVDAIFADVAAAAGPGSVAATHGTPPTTDEPRHGSRAGLSRAAALRRAAPGSARRRARRRRRTRGRRAGRTCATRRDARGRPGAGGHRAACWRRSSPGRASASAFSSPCSRCWPMPPTTWPKRCRRWVTPRSSTSSTARAFRCTRRATRCWCSRARCGR